MSTQTTYHVLNATVFAFRVLSYGDDVHIRVRGLVALDGHARTDIGIQVKRFTEQQVHGWVASSYGSFQRAWKTSRGTRDVGKSSLEHNI